jgi:hypothetical protein
MQVGIRHSQDPSHKDVLTIIYDDLISHPISSVHRSLDQFDPTYEHIESQYSTCININVPSFTIFIAHILVSKVCSLTYKEEYFPNVLEYRTIKK